LNPVEKYLARYAEPETSLAPLIFGRFAASLVVPALAESPELVGGYRAAARQANGRVLVVLIVNATANASSELRAENSRLIEAWTEGRAGCVRVAPGVHSIADSDFELLVVDRSSPGRELPPKQGVGLARKIGLDLALALHVGGALESPWLRTTDADALLPPSYFDDARSPRASVVAAVAPFRHGGPDAAETDATLLYEMALRYQVLGLAWAGSPYAYHSIGSTLIVRADAYASVRGVPKRQAGEDFYLLDKLSKLGPIERASGDAIEIRARRSERVPFGTGPRVNRILAGGGLDVPSPRAFAVLRALLEGLSRFASNRNEGVLLETVGSMPAREAGAAERAVSALRVVEACRAAARDVGAGGLERRVMTWFDALRTLQFLHALRDAGLHDVPLESALEAAPFTAIEAGASRDDRLALLRALEHRLPPLVGPALLP
jgi:hypothetical protein